MLNLQNKNFDLNLLKALDALLSEKNVTRAARLVHVSQSTMSGTFRRLREEFDDPLLVRHGRHYELSPLGRALSVSVRHVLLQVDAMVSTRSLFDPATDSRSFKIMVSDYGTQVFLSKVLQITAKIAGNVRYDLSSINSPFDHILDGTVDMCIIGDEVYNNADDNFLRSDILFEDKLCFIVSKDHPLTGTVAIEEIQKYPHIYTKFSGVETPSSLQRFLEKGLKKPDTSVSGFAMIPHLVEGTRAIGMLPCRMMAETALGVRRLDVDFSMPRFSKQLVWHSRFDYDPAFFWLRNIMLDCASSLVDTDEF